MGIILFSNKINSYYYSTKQLTSDIQFPSFHRISNSQ